MLDSNRIKQDFPILQQTVHGKPLVYLDSAASAQKPQQVINAISHYYQHDHANVHRGVHSLSERATSKYEDARLKVKQFINANSANEIVFVRGATEAINLVADSFAGQFSAGDEIIVTTMEHHSNLVPWQIVCKNTGAILRVIEVTDNGELDLEHYQSLLNEKTKLVAVTHVSNVLGTVNPIEKIIQLAHEYDTRVLIDGAQAVLHMPVDMQALDCDFYVFSGHKMYGPTGIGVLYGKQQLLQQIPPYQTGGGMINTVMLDSTTFAKLPEKFEAGTPNIAAAVGLAAAIDYIEQLSFEQIQAHEQHLLVYALQQLRKIPELRLIGTAKHHCSVVSFVMDDIHPHDVATILDHQGVAIRGGHHCAMPLMQRFKLPATVRASFAVHNSTEDVDALINGLHKVQQLFNQVSANV